MIDAVAGHGQIGVGAGLRPPDAAAQLVELGQAEAVGAVDDQRVGARDVEPAFDDRGRQQHVIFAVVEGAHPLLDLGRAHLAVRGDRLHLGHLLAQPFLDVGQIGDARRDEEALPAAIMFAQQRLAHHHRVPRRDVGAHREPVDRRGLDDRQFAQARHRHLQRARDRRRGQRQDVDVCLERLQPLLVGDPEMLLLVDDDQAELLELDRLAEQRVGADDDVDLAVLEPLRGLLGLGRRDQPRQPPDLDREAVEALGEILVMLAGEQGGRGRSARPACPAIAATKAARSATSVLPKPTSPHTSRSIGLPDAEIVEHVGDRAVLVVGLLIGEAVDELREGAVGLGDPAGAGGAQRRGLDQLARDLADPLLHPRLAPLPRLAAEPVERRRRSLSRAVAGQHVDILDRHVELVAAGIFERDAIVRRLADRDRGQARRSGRCHVRRGRRGRRA